jgi:hypothetical protein
MQQTSITQCITLLAFLALTACGPDAGQPASGKGIAEPAQVAEPSDDDSAVTPPAPSRSTAPQGARVFFIAPEDGAVVSSPVEVRFGVEGMEVVPAGQAAPHSGHHHVLVDTGLPALELPVPADANHIHFGDGRSSTELTLEPGKHTLQLLFADYLHIPHDPPVYSEPITITVE